MIETIKRTRQVATRRIMELCADGAIGYPVAIYRINRIDREAQNTMIALSRYMGVCYGND